jgi:hypothetical protein
MKRDLRCLSFAALIIAAVLIQSCARSGPLLVPAAANIPGGTLFLAEAFENGDFSQGNLGEWPSGWHQWSSVTTPLCAAKTVSARDKGANYADCKSGARCAKVQARGRDFPAPCFFSQGIDARTYRGRSFTFRANIRAEVSSPSIVYLLARVHTDAARAPSATPLTTTFFEHVPVTADRWTNYEISGVVDADAHDIELGLQIRGGGDAWIDNASLRFSKNPKYSPRAGLYYVPRIDSLQAALRGPRLP